MSTTDYEPLREMFERAKADGLWFYNSYQGLWFSPSKLAKENADGNFRWGPVNWVLRDPKERLFNIPKLVKEMEEHNERYLKEIEDEK